MDRRSGPGTGRIWRGAVLIVALAASSCTADSESEASNPSASQPDVSQDAAPASTSSTTSAETTTTSPAESTEPTQSTLPPAIPPDQLEVVAFAVPAGSRPHDVAPAVDGGVWYTAQGSGELGWLDPTSGETRHIQLGANSRPHGVIVDSEGTPWITDGGLNAIVAVNPETDEVTVFSLPDGRADANLNTAAFDASGMLWFTGQNGIHGVLNPQTGGMDVFDSPRGRGPYGIAATPQGDIYYASLAGSYLGSLSSDGQVTVLDPPTPNQGARRVWSDSSGALWVSEWNSGQLSRYEPSGQVWTTWLLPGDEPMAYAVYVDDTDIVWVSDFGGNTIHRFDPTTERFDTFDLPSNPSRVRQILGRPGEVWGAESAADQLVVIRRR